MPSIGPFPLCASFQFNSKRGSGRYDDSSLNTNLDLNWVAHPPLQATNFFTSVSFSTISTQVRAVILEWSLDSPTTATERLDNSFPLLSM